MAPKKKAIAKKKATTKKLTRSQELWVAAYINTCGDIRRSGVQAGIGLSTSYRWHSQPDFAHVQAALNEAIKCIEKEAVKKAAWDKAKLVKQFVHLGDMAIAKENINAAISAFRNVGELLGHYVIKNEISGKLSWAELAASLQQDEPE